MITEPDYENMSVFEQLLEGLNQSVAQARGELNLKTTTLPAAAPTFSKTQVAAIRRRTGMSQAVFAHYLNVPTRTLQSWEQGARIPKAGEARLLQMFDVAPAELVRIMVACTPERKQRRRAKKKKARSRM